MVRLEGRPVGGSRPHRMVRERRRHRPRRPPSFHRHVGRGQSPRGHRPRRALARRRMDPRHACSSSFPILREKRSAPVQSLSGGQQQMVAIGRALLNQPRLAALRRDQPRSRAEGRARDLPVDPVDRAARHRHRAGRAGCRARQIGLEPALLHAGRPRHADGTVRGPVSATRSAKPISEPLMQWLDGRRPRPPAGWALCAICARHGPDVRRDADRQHQPWRPHDPAGADRDQPRRRHSCSGPGPCWPSSWRSAPASAASCSGLILNRVVGADPLPSLIATFGLSIALQNAMLADLVRRHRARSAAAASSRPPSRSVRCSSACCR